jgi:NAD(P)-dependent dehydrogenase (short-subunit alcohol dehydrogenase family)
MQRFDLKGKVALVTGGNGGIGSGIARGLLECGAAVVIAGRNVEKNEAMVAELRTLGPPVSAVTMDVTDEPQCHAAVRETTQRHGRLDILVNNAGSGNGKLPQDITVTEWHEVMNTNLTSAFMLSQAAYPEMKKVGGGKIINIGSMASHLAIGGVPGLRGEQGRYHPVRTGMRRGMGEGQHPGQHDLARLYRHGDDPTTATTRRRVPHPSIGPYRSGPDGHARGFRRRCCLLGKLGV